MLFLQWIAAVTAQCHGGFAQYFVSVLLLCRQRRNNSAFKHKLCSLDVAQLNPVGFSPWNRKKQSFFSVCMFESEGRLMQTVCSGFGGAVLPSRAEPEMGFVSP